MDALDALYPENPPSASPRDEKREELFDLHRDLCQKALSIMQSKNADYGRQTDPFANFHHHGALGIMVRLYDKFCRIESFLEKGFNAVISESIEETIVDGINYLVLLLAYLKSKNVV